MFKDRVAKYILSKQRVWSHDRSKTLGASEAFGCLRRAWFARNKPEAAAVLSLGAAERGNVIERHFSVPMLKSLYGATNVHMTSDDQETLFIGDVSCTPDGLVETTDRHQFKDDGLPDLEADSFVAEFKSFDPRKDMDTLNPQHAGQAGLQIEFVRRHTPFRPQYAVVIPVNASFFDDVRVFFVPYDPNLIIAAQERATRLYAAKTASAIPAEGALSDDCEYCPFQNICADTSIKAVARSARKLSDTAQIALDSLIAEHHQLHPGVERDKARLKELTSIIQTLLNENGTNSGTGADYKVRLSVVKGRESISKDAVEKYIRENNLDREEFVNTGNPYVRTTITYNKS